MKFSINAVITEKGTPHDPIEDDYGITVTAHPCTHYNDSSLVGVHHDLELHCDEACRWFLVDFMARKHCTPRQTQSCLAMYEGWKAKTERQKAFHYITRNVKGNRLEVTIALRQS